MSTSPSTTSSEQRRGIWITVVAVALFSAVLVTGFVFKLTAPRHLSMEELQVNNAWLFDRPRELSAFQLVDHDNKPFHLANLQGHWSILFFGFTFCPDVCPTTLAQLDEFYGKLPPQIAADTRVYLVSVDPARDTPERLKEYVTYFNPRFKGITGEFLALHQFATQLNSPFVKVPGGGENYQVEHSANIALVNPRGHYVGFLKAPHDISRMLLTYQAIRAQR